MSKTCIACGMPMTKPAEFAGGDENKEYCLYCARPDGSMRSYDETLEGLTQFVVRTQGVAVEAAGRVARSMMANLPAWQGRSA